MEISIQEWWSNLLGVQQLLWILAIFFTLLFFLQMIAALLGFNDGDDIDTGSDFSEASIFFTLRNAVVFFLGFSWGGLALIEEGLSVFWGTFIGIMMVAINLLLLRGLATLSESGNLKLENAIGKVAEVSIPIPAKLTSCGKINIIFQSRLEEMEALTEGESIPRGTKVKITKMINNQFVVTNLS